MTTAVQRSSQVLFVASLAVVVLTLWTLFCFLFPVVEPTPNLGAADALVSAGAERWLTASRTALFNDVCLLLLFVLAHSFLLPLLRHVFSAPASAEQGDRHAPLTRTIHGLVSCVLLLLLVRHWQPTPLAHVWSAPSWLQLPVQWWYCCSWILLLTQCIFFDQLKLVDVQRFFPRLPTSSTNILNYSAHPFFIAPLMITGCRLLLTFTADKLLFAAAVVFYLLATNNFTDAETVAIQQMLLGRVSQLRRADWYQRFASSR